MIAGPISIGLNSIVYLSVCKFCKPNVYFVFFVQSIVFLSHVCLYVASQDELPFFSGYQSSHLTEQALGIYPSTVSRGNALTLLHDNVTPDAMTLMKRVEARDCRLIDTILSPSPWSFGDIAGALREPYDIPSGCGESIQSS